MDFPKIEELNAANCRACSLQKKWPDFYEYLQSTYPTGKTLSEKLALYYHGLSEAPKCAVCGSPVKFINFRAGWYRTCSKSCQSRDPLTKIHRQNTLLGRYGVDNVGKVKKFQYKMKQTCLERYGVENAGWTLESQKKIKETNLKRRGVEYAMQSENVKQKSKQTCLKRYGFSHNTSNPLIKEKVAVTNQSRYGGTGFASPELLKKSLETCSKKFDSVLPINNVSQIPEIQNKILQTRRESFLSSSPDVIGYTSDFDWICKCPHPECTKCEEKQYITHPITKRNRERIGVEACTHLLPTQSQHSTMELWVRDILESTGVKYEIGNRKILEGQEIDIYCPDLKVGFECNDCYWHSSQYKSSRYHENKTTEALKQGIRLYHVWEDWIYHKPDIIKSMILNWIGHTPDHIGARQCSIRKVSRIEGMNFLQDNHIQGRSSYELGYGLFYKGELVSLMTFGHKRGCMGNRNEKKIRGEWELIRFCSKLYTRIPGAASKLLQHFIRIHQPHTLYSYASRDISTGHLYESLGFQSDQKITSSYWYINSKDLKRCHRTSFTKDRIVKMGWKKNKEGWTELEAVMEHGYFRIYDSGQTKWIWNKDITHD